MCNKRGQLALFVIIAIVLTATLLLIFFLKPAFRPDIKTEANNIRAYVQDSLKESTETALIILGAQGGYINPEQPYYVYDGIKISYWYYNESYFYPTLTEIFKIMLRK